MRSQVGHLAFRQHQPGALVATDFLGGLRNELQPLLEVPTTCHLRLQTSCRIEQSRCLCSSFHQLRACLAHHGLQLFSNVVSVCDLLAQRCALLSKPADRSLAPPPLFRVSRHIDAIHMETSLVLLPSLAHVLLAFCAPAHQPPQHLSLVYQGRRSRFHDRKVVHPPHCRTPLACQGTVPREQLSLQMFDLVLRLGHGGQFAAQLRHRHVREVLRTLHLLLGHPNFLALLIRIRLLQLQFALVHIFVVHCIALCRLKVRHAPPKSFIEKCEVGNNCLLLLNFRA
mmetsp:Transcript_6190/g.17284  ORF Transcript_6190/g.17284 Transcript_6190/m.17284 type:complete len:284 (-) Transcript_6190:460-1311(-)